MTVLCSLESVSGKELAVKDKAAAHAGTDKEADYVLVALARTVLVFAENAYVNVVTYIERRAELLSDGSRDIVILPGKVRGS